MPGPTELGDLLALGLGPGAGVLQQRPPGVFDQLCGGVLSDRADRGDPGDPGGPAGGVPLGATDLVDGEVGQFDHVERVGAHLGAGAVGDHAGVRAV